jgi:hypothetical protein
MSSSRIKNSGSGHFIDSMEKMLSLKLLREENNSFPTLQWQLVKILFLLRVIWMRKK